MSIEEVFSRGSSTKGQLLAILVHYVAFHTSRNLTLLYEQCIPKVVMLLFIVLAAHQQMGLKIQFRVASALLR
ncbi:hypothetical protein OUZ56_033426 [Daphnia magna]|uniref:Uncharacterized protein n=1 Tax=Daphnia magna TaxID=35525 RepID=A0ABQ9ZXT6_9CRUS|nr:hypothetical protein OUZ56_033426 [Daphnia magna]